MSKSLGMSEKRLSLEQLAELSGESLAVCSQTCDDPESTGSTSRQALRGLFTCWPGSRLPSLELMPHNQPDHFVL
jgi:hypothetical protein